MKKLLALAVFYCCLPLLQAQYTIPDSAFAAALRVIVPSAMDGDTLDEMHTDVTSLTTIDVGYSGIADLDGLQHFVGLIELDCRYNYQVTQLPQLPSTLTGLICGGNALISLPVLPNSLRFLSCGPNDLVSLPPLPDSLATLGCIGNYLTSLPALPSSLRFLQCFNNQLTGLPILPDSLETLYCSSNLLSQLPPLPNSMIWLSCHFNQLTTLPSLPGSLEVLGCEANQLNILPTLPNSLKYLSCDINQLTVLPILPDSLKYLTCYDNQLDCLPVLPNSLETLECYGNPIQCLPNVPNAYDPGQSNLGFTPVLCSPSSPCYPPESIAGTFFNDANGNGQLDTGEQPILAGVAEAQPGNYLSGADLNGNYVMPVDTGTYIVQGQPVLYYNISTPVYIVSILSGQIDTLSHIGYQPIPGIYDLLVDIQATPARPGFDNNVHLHVQNIGTETTIAAVNFDLDLDQTWVNSSIIPDTQNGNNATWSVPMAPGDTWNTTVTLNTSVSTSLGTPIVHLFSATPTQADTTPGDNIEAWNGVVVGSYDPNIKTASPSSMIPLEVQNGEYIEYTIQFQNTGTAPAETVQITDTLSSDLQWNTIEVISSSHSNYWYQSEGVLHFVFNNIDLPDSTSDEPNSHGFVKFRIKPVNTLMAGDEVENTANIYFDFNEPVITDPSVFEVTIPTHIAELDLDGLKLWPNPVNGKLWLLLTDPEPSTIEVLDLTGKVLSSQKTNGTREQLIDVNQLVSGVYFVRVINVDGIRSGRFVKL